MQEDKIPVSESEYVLLKKINELKLYEFSLNNVENVLHIDKSKLASLIKLLESKSLVKTYENKITKYILTDKGKENLEKGLPEEKLITLLSNNKNLNVSDIKNLLKDADIALGQARKKGLISINNNIVELKVPLEEAKRTIEETKKSLMYLKFDENLKKELISRGLIKEVIEKEVIVKVDKNSINKVEILVSRLNHEILSKGLYKEIKLREYDITADPPKIYPAKKHYFSEFIEELKDIMKELGFKETEGPIIEMELFNFDLLFQPQDHPAREIHDTLWIKEPQKGNIDELMDLVKKVSYVHEKGWKYKFNPEISARLILRSQTTSVSIRTLLTNPQPPIRYFTIGKVYRSDVVDSSHLPEFYQLDGIMGDSNYTFKDLLGFLKEFASRLGLDIKFKPGYFPFTEPSVEGYANISGKWIELFGAGLFRPEVLSMVGVDYPVGAWGMGVERLAMARLNISDIRLLYSQDYNFLREFRTRR
ncbi:MAG: phenylalanine--tRNA ligase subunit alpha [Caldisphaera sp.]|jgi:phenylalanyl-tRNA synthetase alpha chain|nr:MAG: phenylalanine--tRNA ligase subunit alpha [Caldisphaera sp.]